MEQRIQFTGKGAVSLARFELAAPGPAEVEVRAICSLISTGTELIVLQRIFDPGSHWDCWVKYPFHPGYAMVGEVTKIGAAVTTLRCGDRVACRAAHATAAVLPAEHCHLVPDGIPSDLACWFALAKIAAMGARVANYGLGTSVAVIGAGPVGQMSARWALAAGADPVFLVDTVKMRLDLACRNGGFTPVCASIDAAIPMIADATKGRLADVVIDSTGHPAVFASALGVVADRGRLVLLGDTGSPGEQRLTKDLLTRGLTVVGAHDSHEDSTWNSRKIVPLFFKLHLSGRFRLDGMTTHRFQPSDCAEAYRTASEQRAETMGMVFDWNT